MNFAASGADDAQRAPGRGHTNRQQADLIAADEADVVAGLLGPQVLAAYADRGFGHPSMLSGRPRDHPIRPFTVTRAVVARRGGTNDEEMQWPAKEARSGRAISKEAAVRSPSATASSPPPIRTNHGSKAATGPIPR